MWPSSTRILSKQWPSLRKCTSSSCRAVLVFLGPVELFSHLWSHCVPKCPRLALFFGSWALFFASVLFVCSAENNPFGCWGSPRPYKISFSVALHCGITSPGYLRGSRCIFRIGIPGSCHGSPRFQPQLHAQSQLPPGCPGRVTRLAFFPLMGPAIEIRRVAASAPLAPPPKSCSSCEASRVEPSPCKN